MNTDDAVSPGWSVDRAIRLMREREVDRLPVVRDGQIVGVITINDLLSLEEILDTISQHNGQGLGP